MVPAAETVDGAFVDTDVEHRSPVSGRVFQTLRDASMFRFNWLVVVAVTLMSTGCVAGRMGSGCGGGAACASSSCGGGCESCGDACGGDCDSCQGNRIGVLNRLRAMRCGGGCGNNGCGCRTGCTPGPIAWQSGGLNYSGALACGGGCGGGGCGGNACGGGCGPAGGLGAGGLGAGGLGAGGLGGAACAGTQLNNTPFTPGPPAAQVGYPYYSVRGPRDFLMDNPPTIGR